jgi:hypothetical protein
MNHGKRYCFAVPDSEIGMSNSVVRVKLFLKKGKQKSNGVRLKHECSYWWNCDCACMCVCVCVVCLYVCVYLSIMHVHKHTNIQVHTHKHSKNTHKFTNDTSTVPLLTRSSSFLSLSLSSSRVRAFNIPPPLSSPLPPFCLTLVFPICLCPVSLFPTSTPHSFLAHVGL